MFNLINSSCKTIWKRGRHVETNIYSFLIPSQPYRRINVFSCRNILNSENKIIDAKKSIVMSCDTFGFNNGFIKETKGNVYLSGYQKCTFHSCSPLFSRHGNYQDEDKRSTNILTMLTVSLLAITVFFSLQMDESPYDKTVPKPEKL